MKGEENLKPGNVWKGKSRKGYREREKEKEGK